MSKKAKLPGMPKQDIPLKTIHKGLKTKPQSTAKVVKQAKPMLILDDIVVSEGYWQFSQEYFNQTIASIKAKGSAKPVISHTNHIDDSSFANAVKIGGVKTDSYEEGMEHLYQFPATTHMLSFNYSLLMKEEDGSYNMVDRVKMPCWGALREYHCGTRPNDEWPADLQQSRHIFPKTGNPVAVAIQFHQTGMSEDQNNKYYNSVDEWNRFQTEFVFNTTISPWRKALKDFEFVLKGDIIIGVVIKDTNIDPNIMVNLFRVCGFRESQFSRNWCKMMDKHLGMDGRVAFILACKPDDYFQSGQMSLDRWFSGEPYNLSSGLTFYERESYNRPDIQYMFGGKNREPNEINTWNITQATLEESFTNWLAKQSDGISRVS